MKVKTVGHHTSRISHSETVEQAAKKGSMGIAAYEVPGLGGHGPPIWGITTMIPKELYKIIPIFLYGIMPEIGRKTD